eukprot:scaffold42080_cov183-Amphora_coffeaeformis.AAC.2
MSGGAPGPVYKNDGQFKIQDEKVPLGETLIHVKHNGTIQVGDRVYVQRNTNVRIEGSSHGSVVTLVDAQNKWIKRLGMDHLEDDPKAGANNWKPETYVQKYERTVIATDEESITIHVGVPCTIQENFGGGEIIRVKPDRRMSHCGVEYMDIVSDYNGEEDEDHGWKAVDMNCIRDSWVRNVSAYHFGYSCVSIDEKAIRITVQDCK